MDRIKLNQIELQKLRNFKNIDLQTDLKVEKTPVKEESSILDKFLELKKDLNQRKVSKNVEREFRKLEKSVKYSIPNSLEKEIILQKLEIQRLLKYFLTLTRKRTSKCKSCASGE